MNLKKLALGLILSTSLTTAQAGVIYGNKADPSVKKSEVKVIPIANGTTENVVVNNSALSSEANVVTIVDNAKDGDKKIEFKRQKENPCDSLYISNKHVINDEIRDCRIAVAKSKGHIQECRDLAKVDDDYNNCLADRGTSQKAIDSYKKFVKENKGKSTAKTATVDNFKHSKKNSVIRTFHFWEILEQHQAPVLHARLKNATIRTTSYSHNSDGEIVYKSSNNSVKIYNTPVEMCKMMRDEKDNFFDTVHITLGEPAALTGYPDRNPHRTSIRHEDYRGGKVYKQASETIGIGEDGEYIKARNGEKGKFYTHFLKITCVRQLKDGEEADEALWKKESRIFHQGFDELYEYRSEQGVSKGGDDKVISLKPVVMPNGRIIYPGRTSNKSSTYQAKSGGKFTSGIGTD